MRVLIVTSIYPSPCDPGRAPFNRALYRALAGMHDVRVIAPVAWTDELRAIVRKRDATRLGRARDIDGLSVSHPRYIYPPGTLRWTYGACYRWSIAPEFTRAVGEFSPDVVLAAWAYPDTWAAVKLARAHVLPVVAVVHGSDLLSRQRTSDARVRALTREALCGASHVVAVSRHLAAEAEALGVERARLSVLYLGIDRARFVPGPQAVSRARLSIGPGAPILLFVGRLVPIKGVNLLFRALTRVASSGQDFRCYLIGDGPLRGPLESLAASLGLTDRLRFMGEQPNEELPDWYRAADLVVLPQPLGGTADCPAGVAGLPHPVCRDACRRHSRTHRG